MEHEGLKPNQKSGDVLLIRSVKASSGVPKDGFRSPFLQILILDVGKMLVSAVWGFLLLLPGVRVRLISISASCCLFFPSQKAQEDRSWRGEECFYSPRSDTSSQTEGVCVLASLGIAQCLALGAQPLLFWSARPPQHNTVAFAVAGRPPWLPGLFAVVFFPPRGCSLGALQHFLTSVVCLLWFLWSGMFSCLSCCSHPPAGEHRNEPPGALLVLIQSFGAGSEAEFIEIPGILSREIAHGVHLWQESSLFPQQRGSWELFPQREAVPLPRRGCSASKASKLGVRSPHAQENLPKSAQICYCTNPLALAVVLGLCCCRQTSPGVFL